MEYPSIAQLIRDDQVNTLADVGDYIQEQLSIWLYCEIIATAPASITASIRILEDSMIEPIDNERQDHG